jgi:hypothetical protein
MAQKMNLWISKMDYTLFDDFPEVLNSNRLALSFKFDQADGRFLLEMHLVIRSDTINLSLQPILNAVHISDTPRGGFSLSIG